MRRPVIAAVALVALGVGCAPAPTTSPTSPLPASPSSAAQSRVSHGPTAQPSASATPSGSRSTQASPKPTRTGPSRTVTMNVSGDLLWHSTLWRTAQADAKQTGAKGYDFAPQLAHIASYISKSDIAVCHEEVPFGKPEGPFKNYPMFNVPPQTAAAIKKTGFDICTTASNHSVDAGFDGLVRTLDGLDTNGVAHVGMYRSEAESKGNTILTTKDGVKVAFVSATFGLNGLPMPKGKPWAVQLLNTDELIARAKRAREAGADIVAVHMHAGTEYQTAPNSEQINAVKALTASAYVDVVFGQHAHVVQPVSVVNGKWVVYGTGNLIAQNSVGNARTFDGVIVEVTFTEGPDGRFSVTSGEFAPTFITKYSAGAPARVYQITKALAQKVGNAAELRASAERTRKTILSKGVTLAER